VTDNTATSATVTSTGYRSIMRANTVVAGNANWAYSGLREWTNVYTCTGASAGAYCYTVLAASYLTARVTATLSPACASTPSVGAKPSVAPGSPNSAITSIAIAKTASGSTCPPTYTYAGQTATLTGRVTALVAGGFYMQDSAAVNSGIFVANTVQNFVDQVVTVTAAALVQYGGQLQLQGGSVTVSGSLATPAALSFSTPPSGLLTACSPTSSPGGVQYEGMVAQFSSSVTLQAATASNGNQLGYLVTTGGMLVLATQSYMQNYQAGATFASMDGVIVGTPAVQNAFAALYPRGPADLGVYSKTISTSATCVVAGQCTGATVGSGVTAGAISYTPLSIFSAGMRPFGPLTMVPGTSFAPTGYTPMSAVGAVTVPAVSITSSSSTNTVGGSGYAGNPSSVFLSCSASNASVWGVANSAYTPYLGKQVYIEGIFTSVASVSQYMPITDFSYVTNPGVGVAAVCDATCTAALPAGAAALAYFTSVSGAGVCAAPSMVGTAGGSWCASCVYPSGYYMSTSEVAGPFSGVFVNLNPDQLQSVLTNLPYPMATFCPTFTGASLLPQLPSSTTTLRLGVTGTLVFDSDTGSGLVLSSITSTTVLSTDTAMVQAQQLSTQAFSYGWTSTQNNALNSAIVTSPVAPTVCAATTPAISNPAFVPYKGAVVSFPNVTVMSYTLSVVVSDQSATSKSGYYVVTDTNAAQAYPVIISSVLYGSWKPQALSTTIIPPSLFQCAIIAPLTGIIDWNPNLLAWTIMPRFSNDIAGGALSLSLNTRCTPSCSGLGLPTSKQLAFPSPSVVTANLPGPTAAAPACAYPPPPPPSPPLPPPSSPSPPVGPLPGPTTTTWTGAVSALGVAGSPSARTLFISYYSNWQYNVTASSSYPPILNSNYNVIRASPGAACRLALRN